MVIGCGKIKKTLILAALLVLLTSSHIASAATMRGGWGCVSESDCQKIAGFIQSDNLAAYQAELSAEIASGAATSFNDPETVIVDSHDGIFVKIHRPGEDKTYWTMSELVYE
jgi:hypothetical protein